MDAKNPQEFVEDEKTRKPDQAELKVSSVNEPEKIKKLASAIYSKVKEYGYAKLRCIGPAAVGNGFKAFVIASANLRLNDSPVVATGAFFSVRMENGEIRDGIVINVDPE